MIVEDGRKLKNEWEQLKKYICKNRWQLLISSLLLFLLYGSWLFHVSAHIDTEVRLNDPNAVYNWLEIGRYGLIFTELVFGTRWFNPFFMIGMGVLLLWGSGVLVGYLCNRLGGIDSYFSAWTGFFILCCPLMIEQLYFTLQIFEIGWAYLICIAVAGLSWYAVLNNSLPASAVSIFGMVWAFSSYQAFVILYLTVVVYLFIIIYRRRMFEEHQNMSNKYCAECIAKLMILLGIAFSIYSIISKIWFSKGGYIDGQVWWGKSTVQECFIKIFNHIKTIMLGQGVFYTKFYGIFALLAVFFLLHETWKNKKCNFMYLLAILGFQMCPLLLTIYCGNLPAARTQIIYPVVLALNMMLCIWMVKKRKIQRLGTIVIVCGIVICIWTQMGTCARLLYTDNVRMREDERIAAELEMRVHAISPNQRTLAIIGAYPNKLNRACVRGELIGTSIFAIDYAAQPHFVFSTSRACNLMREFGIAFTPASADQMIEARKIALNMPSWPANGSVIDAGDYAIVKFSDDLWSDEILELVWEKCTVDAIEESLMYCVDNSVVEEEGELSIYGWLFQKKTNSGTVTPTAYFRDSEAEEYYRVSIIKQHRPDLITAFPNGDLYEYAGFKVKVPIEMLEKPLTSYQLILGLKFEDGTEKITTTGYQWPEQLYSIEGVR